VPADPLSRPGNTPAGPALAVGDCAFQGGLLPSFKASRCDQALRACQRSFCSRAAERPRVDREHQPQTTRGSRLP